MADPVQAILMSPMAVALAVKLASAFLAQQLKKLDSNHIAQKYGIILQVTDAALTGLASLVHMLVQGHGGDFDVNAFLSYFVQVFSTAKVVDVAHDGAKARLVSLGNQVRVIKGDTIPQ